ncbi:olfactory receptor 4S1-like [Tachyglossus aculeatus]|uniref:olfactory receptor 4S1-like n=1 Tax=Tachyglossus aculeatus TaxID=9261 RepID=UPI0018F5E932|nr:olfactory receptor 4S1-like [Tachyglossus aculeatus]
MEKRNNVTEFVFLGILQNQVLQRIWFALFVLYMVTLFGNHLIMTTINVSPRPASPMYFFFGYLSFVCYSTTTTPEMMADLFAERKTISSSGCMTQLFAMHFFYGSEIFLLTVMVYDWCVTICRPLSYPIIMSQQVCQIMVTTLWGGAFLHSIVQSLLTIQLPFCGSNVLEHYFCDVNPLMKLSCTDTSVVGLMVVANSGMISWWPSSSWSCPTPTSCSPSGPSRLRGGRKLSRTAGLTLP